MKFTPMYDQVLVRLGAFRKNTKAGLVLPKDVALNDFPIQFAEVVEAGPGGPLESGGRRPMDVQEGDVVALHAKCPKIRVPSKPDYDSQDPSRLVIVNVIHIVSTVECSDDERTILLDPDASDEDDDEGDSGAQPTAPRLTPGIMGPNGRPM